MFNLFQRTNLAIVDGDGRIDACEGIKQAKLENFVNQGIDIWGIQIFHYASVHYATRWNNWPGRFLNALMNGIATISPMNGCLALNDREYHELKGNSSEVLAIGLGNLFMCKWFDLKLNSIERIEGTKKRCDYKFFDGDKTVVYETKGRSEINNISSAQKDALDKKKHHIADEKYSLISYLPRTGEPVKLYVFDPPTQVGENRDDKLLRIAHYYYKATKLAGLTLLSREIGKKIDGYYKNGVWDESSIMLDHNIVKLGWDIHTRDTIYWTKLQPEPISVHQGEVQYYLHFGLDYRVTSLLLNWQLDELLEYKSEDVVIEEKGISVLHDGTLLYLGDRRLG